VSRSARPALPPPVDRDRPVAGLVRALADLLGEEATVAVCLDLLGGADRRAHLPELAYLTGLDVSPGSAVLDPASWKDYWVRTWGARGLLYVWSMSAVTAVVAGLDDEHWRPAEMCLKVATRREVGEAGPGAARLLGHALPRVREQALRTLAVVGDTEHVAAVRERLGDEHPAVRARAGRALESLAARLDLGQT
jgi:HEAT repeat protein